MPTLEITEEQLIKMLANTPLQVDLQLIMMDSDYHKKEDLSHLNQFYRPYREVKDEKFDGMIITGAPVEKLEFEEVDYWDDLSELMDNTKKNVFSTIHICWAAQAGLYYHYNAKKVLLEDKLFGVYSHRLLHKDYDSALTRGFDDHFWYPIPDIPRFFPIRSGISKNWKFWRNRTGRPAYDSYEEQTLDFPAGTLGIRPRNSQTGVRPGRGRRQEDQRAV